MKRYPVKHSILFNLDSMRTHLICAKDELLETCKDDSLEGKMDGLIAELESLEELMQAIWGHRNTATWPELKRAREISEQRNLLRYTTCMAAGMDESDAAQAFFE